MTPPEVPDEESGECHEVRFAAAALLVVCARADFEEHPEEQSTILDLLENTFDLDEEGLHELLDLVDPDAAVTDLQEFTKLVNQHYSAQDKRVLIENLWRVALADGRIDRFEEQPSVSAPGKLHADISASIVVAKASQKAVVIGEQGSRIRRIGTEARADIARLIDGTVRLELWVKVKSGWADDAAAIRAFGVE